MSAALGWALRHPANRGRWAWVVGRWCLHQVRKRALARVPGRVRVGPATLVGPPWHPVICLATYVRGGLVDADAFVVYAALLRPGDVFVDVGANIGLHSVVAASRLGPGGRVVACEPDPASWPWLERNLRASGARWDLETRPLADRIRDLAWRRVGATLSHLETSPARGRSVPTTTLDALMEARRLDPARTLVKADVEGWEPAVLVGARTSLVRGVRAVWIEANGQQGRCDVAWEDAVRICHEVGMRFWVLDLGARSLSEAPEPAPRTQRDYLVATPEAARQVWAVLARWPATLVGDSPTVAQLR